MPLPLQNILNLAGETLQHDDKPLAIFILCKSLKAMKQIVRPRIDCPDFYCENDNCIESE